MKWYLAATKPRQEFKAEEHLNNQQIQFVLPKLMVEKVVRGKVTQVVEPLFPGYIFLGFDDGDAAISKIRSTRGIRDFVRFAGVPAQLPSDLIHLFREEKGPKAQVSRLPKAGDRVAIMQGPFQGLEAVFEMTDGNQRAFVLIEILGKWQRLSLEIDTLQKS